MQQSVLVRATGTGPMFLRRLKDGLPKLKDLLAGAGGFGERVRRLREKALAPACDEFDIKPVEFDRLLGKISQQAV